MEKFKILLLILCTFILIIPLIFASDAKPVYKSEVENNAKYLIDGWDRLPFKDIRALDSSYINWVNNNHGQNWDSTPFFPPDKCLSYSAATMNDWYSIQTGKPLLSYQNYVNNLTESGTNPRDLEAIYLTHSGLKSIYDSYYDFVYVPTDPITGEYMPYDIKGYGDILAGNYPIWINKNDELLGSDYKINVYPELFPDISYFKAKSFFGGHLILSPTYKQIKDLIDKYGIVYAQFETEFIPVHAANLIGYGNFDCDRDGDTEDVFWVHESYTDESGDYSKYKAIETKYINEVLAFYDPQWPFYHHDLRRTGFTLLKGDFNDKNIQKVSTTIDVNIDNNKFHYPSVADLDIFNNFDDLIGGVFYV